MGVDLYVEVGVTQAIINLWSSPTAAAEHEAQALIGGCTSENS